MDVLQISKGSMGMLALAALEGRERHGYEIARQIEERSEGALKCHAASLYPLLYRMEQRGFVEGRWVEKAGERRRRFYRITAAGKKELGAQRKVWRDMFAALNRVAGFGHA